MNLRGLLRTFHRRRGERAQAPPPAPAPSSTEPGEIYTEETDAKHIPGPPVTRHIPGPEYTKGVTWRGRTKGNS